MKALIPCLAAVAASVAVSLAADRGPRTDKEFIAHALDDGVAEVKLGQLGERLASSQKVKDFAEKMVTDHTRANKRLMDLAKAQKMAVVTDVKKDAQAIYNRMSRLDKKEFEQAYMKHMVADHKKAIDLFERISKDATDADLKKFASDTLPRLREHLKMAREINDGLKSR
jgi:putative membrane protein